MMVTILLHIVIVLLLFYVSLNYLDPAPEHGIAVNFGTSDVGNGTNQPKKKIRTTPKPQVTAPAAIKKNEIVEETSEVSEKVVTQVNEAAPVIKNQTETKKKTAEKIDKKQKAQDSNRENVKKEVEKPVEKKPEPKPDKSTLDILDSFAKGAKADGEIDDGQGNNSTLGDKGNADGDPSAKSYYGTGKGLDGDGNYRLGGRKALNKERFVQDCNESGIVVVRIDVDQQGRVIRATPGVKGTTNNANCLMEPAKRAALSTRFNSDAKAPVKQVGTIIYQFEISE
ncbi:energy transducer TonB [Aquimarina sp. W85]|uniref:energy transducer TonB n=1 Tax=Aquimarina rhodophyticola TaxID=3342246 RepID=UPI00366BB117